MMTTSQKQVNPSHKTILVVSNGHGEDLIATRLILALQKKDPTLQFIPIPLLGDGNHYTQIGLAPQLQTKELPSGGFIRSLGDLRRDINAGLFGLMHEQKKAIKAALKRVDISICVGDIYCLWRGSRHNPTPIIFLPTAKSDLFMPHSWLEKRMMRRYTTEVFPRDMATTRSLQQAGINARYLGNAMMDGLEPTGSPLDIPKNATCIALLPGSRQEAYDNAHRQLDIIKNVDKTYDGEVTCVIALASSLSLLTLVDTLGSEWVQNGQFLVHSSGFKALVSHAFNDVIHRADLICGLSGTANEQALYIGKTVVAFEGFGPQSTLKRFREQQRLMDSERLIICDKNDVESVSKCLLNELQHPKPNRPRPAEHAADKMAERIAQTLLI